MTKKELLENLSAAMDGEANGTELGRVLDEAGADSELRDAWERYHTIGAVIRGEWQPDGSGLREWVRATLDSETLQASDEKLDFENRLRPRRQMEGFAYLAGFILSIPLANWMIGNVGATCATDGPCAIPLTPGMLAPSSVAVVGLTFVLRDLVQRRLGVLCAIGAVLFGTALSAFVAPASLAISSATAFLMSETADLLVYTCLQRRVLEVAVLASSLVGLTVDSLLFLVLAFGNLDLLAGLLVGKSFVVLLVLPLIACLRRRDDRIGLAPA